MMIPRQRSSSRGPRPDAAEPEQEKKQPLPILAVALPSFALGCLVGPDWGAWLASHAVIGLVMFAGWRLLRSRL